MIIYYQVYYDAYYHLGSISVHIISSFIIIIIIIIIINFIIIIIIIISMEVHKFREVRAEGKTRNTDESS